MKTVPTAAPAPSSSTGAIPSSTVRAASTSTSASSASSVPRSAPIDYRANVERQSREQKSVGSILSYVVYGLIALFVIVVGLAGYGANIIFAKIHDQSQTVSELDQRYAKANKDLGAKLATTQDTLNDAQAQIARQQELILKQQDAINRLIAATNDDSAALKLEKQTRAQETASLRARVRDIEYRGTTTTQKY